jgi:hypothetical protein
VQRNRDDIWQLLKYAERTLDALDPDPVPARLTHRGTAPGRR